MSWLPGSANRLGTPAGLLHATAKIYSSSGIRGLLQGHSATLLRVFPYAGIKFMFYDWIEKVTEGGNMADFRLSFQHQINGLQDGTFWQVRHLAWRQSCLPIPWS